jgi:hypothetical protein
VGEVGKWAGGKSGKGKGGGRKISDRKMQKETIEAMKG